MLDSFTAAWREVTEADRGNGGTSFRVIDLDRHKRVNRWAVMSDTGYVVLRSNHRALAAAVADALTAAAKDAA
jgi:hypothetical protein